MYLTSAVRIRIYTAGRRLGSFSLLCNLFGILHVVGSTGGLMWAVFNCHILIISSFQSVYFYNRLVMMQ